MVRMFPRLKRGLYNIVLPAVLFVLRCCGAVASQPAHAIVFPCLHLILAYTILMICQAMIPAIETFIGSVACLPSCPLQRIWYRANL